MSDLTPIGKHLKRARTSKKWTQVELAQGLGVSRSTLAKWEAGENVPDAESIKKACGMLGVGPSVLLGMEPEEFPESAHDRLKRVLKAEGTRVPAKLLGLTTKQMEPLMDGRLQASTSSMRKIAQAYGIDFDWLRTGHPGLWVPNLESGIAARLRFVRIGLGKPIPEDYWRALEKSEAFAVEERDSGRLSNLWNLQMVTSQEDNEGMAAMAPYDLDWILTGILKPRAMAASQEK